MLIFLFCCWAWGVVGAVEMSELLMLETEEEVKSQSTFAVH